MTLETFNAQYSNRYVEKCPVRLLGCRGYNLTGGQRNHLGIYDDAIISCIDGKISTFQASTDPGQYYLNNPLDPSGCAQLCVGLWYFTIGLHIGHLALKQARKFRVNRLDPSGKINVTQEGWFGIDLHSGGANPDIGKWSAGCQIIYCPEGGYKETWEKFFEPIYQRLKGSSTVEIPYLLIDSQQALPPPANI